MLPDSALISQILSQRGVNDVDVHAFEALDSTSGWIRARLAGSDGSHRLNSPCLCITDWQTAGVARRGKTWQTKPGNITFSLLEFSPREPQDLMGFSLATGIAIAKALNQAIDLDIRLKWPNDVILNDAKLGGLLTEIIKPLEEPALAVQSHTASKPAMPSGSQIISGLGLNVLADPDIAGLGLGATSLEAAGISMQRPQMDHLVALIAAEIIHSHRRFERHGWAAFENQWKRFDWLADKEVLIHGESATETAIARGVSQRGALLIEQHGNIKSLYSGNVSIRPKV